MQLLQDKHFKKLFEVFPDAVVLIDTVTKLPVLFNQAAYTQLEYKKDEFKKLTISDYEALETPEEIERHIQNIIKNGRDDFETKHKTKHGKMLDIKVTVVSHIIENKPYFLCTFRDITKEKNIEIAHKKSEERLTIATDSANIGVWEYELASGSLLWNLQMYRIYGISPDSFAGSYDAWVSALHPDDLKTSTDLFAKALEDPKTTFDPEFRILWPDGTLRYIKANAKVMRNAQGEALRIVGVNCDITTLKNAEQALKQSEEQFRGIFEKANCGIAYSDKNGKLMLCNDHFASMIKYTQEEIGNMDFLQLTHPEDTAIELPLFEEILSQKRDGYRLKKRYICKDGQVKWVDLAVSVIRDEQGNPLNYLGAVIDITKEKLLEEEIIEKEKRFRDVAEASGECIWELDAEGKYIFLTKPFEDMLGYTTEEGLGKTPFSFMPKDEEVRVGEYFMNEVAAKGIPFRGLVHRSLTKAGETVWQKVNGLPMIDKEGNIVGYRGAALDITAEKKAGEELEIAKERAEAANKAKTQFLANMSHEIRTPMNAVIGLGDVLNDMIDNPRQKDVLYKINSSSKMLLGVINDILDYSKIEAGKLELEHKQFRLEDVLSQLKVMFESKASQKGVELYFFPKGECAGLLLGDELRLTQALTNLLSNAIKFTHKGNITLTIECLHKQEHEKATISFSVEDSGIGMSEEHLSKLFKPFSQADSSTTRKHGGTGLGLVISKNIINAMGAEIAVQSQVGVGTKFSFTLDFELSACVTDAQTSNSTAGKVLIVDDQEISREVLKSMLGRFGYAFDEASNGAEAIECIKTAEKKKSPYDILLIDWNMPILNGVETIKELQTLYEQKELTSKVPTVFMVSGYSKETIDLGSVTIDSFISKPVTQSALFDAIADARGGKIRNISSGAVQTAPDLTGLTVLIVEDNAVNQEVVGLMLEKVGITYKIANNGQEGLEVFLANQDYFDLILMDLQMPVMGGYEATREIRKHNTTIPIVALTAAAMAEDKEKAFRAGMNGHIGKPIDKNELYNTISQLCGAKINNSDKTKQSSKAVLDKAHLSHILDSEDSANALLLKFKHQLQTGEFQNIIEAIKSNAPDAHKQVHTLKGVSGNIGAFELHEKLAFIDGKYKNNEKIENHEVQSLANALKNLLRALESVKEASTQTQTSNKLSREALDKLLVSVKGFLKEGELMDDDTIHVLHKNLMDIIPHQELAKWKECVEEFEFDKALKIMKKWTV